MLPSAWLGPRNLTEVTWESGTDTLFTLLYKKPETRWAVLTQMEQHQHAAQKLSVYLNSRRERSGLLGRKSLYVSHLRL